MSSGSSPYKADFNSRKLDPFLQRWLSGDLLEAEQEEWKRILMFDSKFREQFCDWVKALREPGWARTASKKGPRR